MKCFGVLFAYLGVAGMLLAGSACSHAQSSAHLDKHARKIHHRLAKYRNGRYLHLVLSDDSSAYGSLGTLSPASFTFTNADSNTVATYNYADIDKVKTDKEAIGEGTEPRRHMPHLVPIVIGAAAVGAGAAIYEAER